PPRRSGEESRGVHPISPGRHPRRCDRRGVAITYRTLIQGASMDFRETEEQQMLRQAVDSIAAKYGHSYFTEKARSGGRTDELWDELAASGFLGVNVPEEYGGGGRGVTELAIVLEKLGTHG